MGRDTRIGPSEERTDLRRSFVKWGLVSPRVPRPGSFAQAPAAKSRDVPGFEKDAQLRLPPLERLHQGRRGVWHANSTKVPGSDRRCGEHRVHPLGGRAAQQRRWRRTGLVRPGDGLVRPTAHIPQRLSPSPTLEEDRASGSVVRRGARAYGYSKQLNHLDGVPIGGARRRQTTA